MSGERLDVALVRRGLAPSRERAKAMIMAGIVFSDTQRLDKPAQLIRDDQPLRLAGQDHPYVSRGGLKLEKALKTFEIPLEGAIALDIGASTGGFTDCLLQHGAARVYAVDVGYGQFDWRLRNDPRVRLLERTNARQLTCEMLGEQAAVAAIDVSFIALRLILPAVAGCLIHGGQIISLVKPQFEAGRGKVNRKGVVRDPLVHLEVLREVAASAVGLGLSVCNATYSPITGPEGNIEFLLHILHDGKGMCMEDQRLADVVTAAHQ